MPYDHLWPPFRLDNMCDYYYMCCRPDIPGGITYKGRYDFMMRRYTVRGKEYYYQREYKGKWKH